MGLVISPGQGLKTLTVAVHVVDPLFSAQADRQTGVDARCYDAICDKLNDSRGLVYVSIIICLRNGMINKAGERRQV